VTPKTYSVEETWDETPNEKWSKHFYDIAYCPSPRLEKHIRFSFIEHYLQFIALLGEAGYTHHE